MNTVKIVGIKKMPNSKDANRIGTTIYYTQVFDSYSRERAVYMDGMAVASDFTYNPIECHVGDEVQLLYAKGFQDKATLAGVQVVKPAK